MKLLAIFLFSSLIIQKSCSHADRQGQSLKQILVIPGHGLVIEKDSIKLGETKEAEIFHLFKLTDPLIKTEHESTSMTDDAGNDISYETYFKYITTDGIVFKYIRYIYEDFFSLEEVRISDTTHWAVRVNESLVLGENIPNILRYFPKRDTSDVYNKYFMNLPSYGIRMEFKDNGSKKKLSNISVFQVIEKKVKRKNSTQ